MSRRIVESLVVTPVRASVTPEVTAAMNSSVMTEVFGSRLLRSPAPDSTRSLATSSTISPFARSIAIDPSLLAIGSLISSRVTVSPTVSRPFSAIVALSTRRTTPPRPTPFTSFFTASSVPPSTPSVFVSWPSVLVAPSTTGTSRLLMFSTALLCTRIFRSVRPYSDATTFLSDVALDASAPISIRA